MTIEPFIKSADIKRSLDFYVNVLDFIVVQAPDPDPSSFMSNYALLAREGCNVHLSAHSSDGAFGCVLYIRVGDIDSLYRKFVDNGLQTEPLTGQPSLRIPPVDQTWGMREFSVTDPDGNKLTFGHSLSV